MKTDYSNGSVSPSEASRILHSASLSGDGLSLRLDGTKPTTGYIVGVEGLDLCLHKNINAAEIVRVWAMLVVGRVKARHKPLEARRAILDVWCDEEYVHYDMSMLVEDRQRAVRYGKANGQSAIWDIAEAEEIPLN